MKSYLLIREEREDKDNDDDIWRDKGWGGWRRMTNDQDYFHKQQSLTSLIMRYGITYLDQMYSPEELSELIDEEERYYE